MQIQGACPDHSHSNKTTKQSIHALPNRYEDHIRRFDDLLESKDAAARELEDEVARLEATVDDLQGRLSLAEQEQATSEQELAQERERSRLLNDEIERLKRELEQSCSGNLAAPDAARVAELEALLSQARADVAKFQALAEKNATAYQNAMARLFPALTSLSAR